MKNKFLFLSLFCSLASLAQTTVPGYLGKRFSIGYSNYMSPALFQPNANSTDPDGGVGFNTVHSIDLEYSIKKRTNFCASVQFYKTGLKTKDYYYSVTDPNSSETYESYVIYKSSDHTPIMLKTTNISLGFKFFRKGFIAPVGKYQRIDFVLMLDKVAYQRNAFYDDGARVASPIGTGDYDFRSFAFAYTLGRQRVIANKIILDAGIRFAICPNYLLNFIKNDVFGDYEDRLPFETALKSEVNQRLIGAQLINLHIGISFLAF